MYMSIYLSSRLSEFINSADSRNEKNLIRQNICISFTQNEILTILFSGIALQLFNTKL